MHASLEIAALEIACVGDSCVELASCVGFKLAACVEADAFWEYTNPNLYPSYLRGSLTGKFVNVFHMQ